MTLPRRALIQVSGVGLMLPSAAAARAPQRPKFIRLSLNENPFGPSERAKIAMREAVAEAERYAYEDAIALRRVIAGKENLKPENVIITEGSGELLKLIALRYGGNGADVIAARPAFPMLAQFAGRIGGTVQWVDLDAQKRHDLERMAAAVTARTGVVSVCNPNNPSGTVLEPARLREFIARVAPRVLVAVDEAYIDFCDDPNSQTLIDRVQSGDNIVIARTFSKLHGLAGQRVGYGLARPDIIRKLESVRISIPNRAGLRGAMTSLADQDFIARSRAGVREAAAYTCRAFDELEVAYVPTQASFVMFDTRRPSAEFYEHMRARGILVAEVFEPLATWCRVSMGRLDEMKAFTAAAAAFFKSI
jgi:histidinol-phosphate aminotransferase